jgi:hypothetical protein
MTTPPSDPMPDVCSHTEPSQCTEECEAKARAFDNWMKRNLSAEDRARLLHDAGFRADDFDDEGNLT